jgi:hypothetical protein
MQPLYGEEMSGVLAGFFQGENGRFLSHKELMHIFLKVLKNRHFGIWKEEGSLTF